MQYIEKTWDTKWKTQGECQRGRRLNSAWFGVIEQKGRFMVYTTSWSESKGKNLGTDCKRREKGEDQGVAFKALSNQHLEANSKHSIGAIGKSFLQYFFYMDYSMRWCFTRQNTSPTLVSLCLIARWTQFCYLYMSRAIPKSPILATLPAPWQVRRQFLAAISLQHRGRKRKGKGRKKR